MILFSLEYIMNQQSKIEQYWKDIEKEISILKENSLKNADIVSHQSDKINQIDYNNKIIDHNVKLSKWLLNLVDSTFGKIYQKLNAVPKKEKKIKLDLHIKKNSLNQNINYPIVNSQYNVINDLKEIKSIHNAMGEEIDKQNCALENINDKTENISDNLENNIRHCKKIIRNN
jgi:hypothetical protein